MRWTVGPAMVYQRDRQPLTEPDILARIVDLNVLYQFSFEDSRTNLVIFCSLLFIPRTRSSGESLLLFNPEPHLIGRVEEQQEVDRLATLARAQVNRQNDGQPARDPNHDEEYFGDDDLINPANRRRAENVEVAINRNWVARGRANYQPTMQFDSDDKEDDLNEASAIGAIIPPPLVLGVKFNITSTMIQLLNLKGFFGGLPGDEPNMHLVNFINICKSFDNPGVGQNAIFLRLFPLSLFGKATIWLNKLAVNFIKKIEKSFPRKVLSALQDVTVEG
ncbi:uncharacterized protein LOC124895926 [Capsicum annuum]|uniref:uncharacterized protein LOC124895926 n=1 Tax=Capsicum annuum TaxID=4072 RepID=UPI001FB17A65|nr:uncharacterized protein LOC124895926 [Capsicum annuum]XP_047262444.1 uncharacterized protein LOC124895926 [Capsicum annuum]